MLYAMSGVVLNSEVALPNALPLEFAVPADVEVRVASIARPDSACFDQEDGWWLDSQRFVMEVPEVGRFAALGGRELWVDPNPGVSIGEVVPFLCGTPFAALIYQRGGLLLHASAVVFEGKAYAICGSSGRGKSTLAAALCAAGGALLCDDICRIEPGPPAIAYSDGRMLKLTPGAIDAVGCGHAKGRRVSQAIDKYFVRPAHSIPETVPLGGIFALSPQLADATPSLSRMTDIASCSQLLGRTFRRKLALALIGGEKLVRAHVALAAEPGVWELKRPQDLARLDEVVELLKDHWSNGAPPIGQGVDSTNPVSVHS